jgi:hypothetical protein
VAGAYLGSALCCEALQRSRQRRRRGGDICFPPPFFLYLQSKVKMQVINNNAELVAALRDGVEKIALVGEFTRITLNRSFKSLLIVAHNALVRGVLVQEGENIEWIGGTIEAPHGAEGFAANGYGVQFLGARDVSFSNVSFRNFDRGMVTDHRRNNERLVIKNNDFLGRQDGIIFSGGRNIRIENNLFHDFYPKPTLCTLPNGEVREGLSRRNCEAIGGTWKDGDHSDAIQFRNGCENYKIIGNIIKNVHQGIGQMDATADLPVKNFEVIGNYLEVSGHHSITFNSKPNENIVVVNNTIRETTSKKTPLRLPSNAVSIGNTVTRV